MTKKTFIALADAIREHNRRSAQGNDDPFTASQLQVLAYFCKSQNSLFNQGHWLAYIANGPSGDRVK